MDVVEAYYRLEPYLREAVRDFVREHLDTYAETEDGGAKEFWVSFYNLEVSKPMHCKPHRHSKSPSCDHTYTLQYIIGPVPLTHHVRKYLFIAAQSAAASAAC